jgi:hypothetical protein
MAVGFFKRDPKSGQNMSHFLWRICNLKNEIFRLVVIVFDSVVDDFWRGLRLSFKTIFIFGVFVTVILCISDEAGLYII